MIQLYGELDIKTSLIMTSLLDHIQIGYELNCECFVFADRIRGVERLLLD